MGIIYLLFKLAYINNFNFILFSYSNQCINLFLSKIIFFSAITKRAQIPFRAWLPIAIAAPTPVSSLVHSSTLVTAGVFFLFRFNIIISNSKIFFFLSFLTTLISSLRAIVETDIKKVVALSTLRHLGIIIFILFNNIGNLTIAHLLFHAFLKASLFITIGFSIHLRKNYQDYRKINNLFSLSILNSLIKNFCLLSLCGLPFITGFYSKEIFLEIIWLNFNNYLNHFFIILVALTSIIYTIKLIKFLVINNNFISSIFWIYNNNFNYANRKIFLIILNITFGQIIRNFLLINFNIFFLPKIRIDLNYLLILIFIIITIIIIYYYPIVNLFFSKIANITPLTKKLFTLKNLRLNLFNIEKKYNSFLLLKPNIFFFTIIFNHLTLNKNNLNIIKIIIFFFILIILIIFKDGRVVH